MVIGDIIWWWSYDRIGEGDVHTGTFIGLVGTRARVKEGNRVKSIRLKQIITVKDKEVEE